MATPNLCIIQVETNTIKSNAMKINTTTRSFLQGILAAALLLLAALPANLAASELTGVARQVRHELVMLPYYGVFDNLEFRVDGSKVSLHGQVHRPSLKKDAERVVQKLESVESVENQIEVLPTSNQDDRIRSDVFRAVYYHPSFTRYAIRAVPPIHIIVKNGNVTLVGPVARKADKDLAFVLANGVSGVFSVKNNIFVEE